MFAVLSRHDGTSFFFFNDTATTEIYTLSLHDALPISRGGRLRRTLQMPPLPSTRTASTFSPPQFGASGGRRRSEEHTSELQSPCNLVCRLLLEKKTQEETSDPYTLAE